MPSSDFVHPLNAYLKRIHHQFGALKEGAVADYIPELGKVDPEDFGIVLVTTDGEVYAVGDTENEFTIQSISKAFVYATAMADCGRDAVLKKVYVEPSGEAFNSISLHPVTGAPLNPMINAGAIATAGLVGGSTPQAQWQRIIDSLSTFAGRPLDVDEAVCQSEGDTGFRNRAIGWMLRNFGIIETDPTPIVENYFRQCSVLVNCRDLGIMGATLANGGINPLTGQRALHQHLVGPTLSVMSTCGMYDYAGSWMFEVGLPAKSGVGGGIVAVLPGRFAVATFSPRLDAKGNSVRGIAACKAISHDLGLHMMSPPRNASEVISREYSCIDASSNRVRSAAARQTLAAKGRSIRILALQGDIELDGAERISRRLLNDETITHAVLDMQRVALISMPAARVIVGSTLVLRQRGGELCFAHAYDNGLVADVLGKAADGQRPELKLFPDADRALEWCENRILGADAAPAPAAQTTLDHFELFANLNADEREALDAMLHESVHRAGSTIVKAGDENDERIFLITEGDVSVLVEPRPGQTQRLATLSTGMTFGEMVILGQRMRTATVHADTNVTCRVLKASDLDQLATTQPHLKIVILNNLATLLAEKLKQANGLVAALAQ